MTMRITQRDGQTYDDNGGPLDGISSGYMTVAGCRGISDADIAAWLASELNATDARVDKRVGDYARVYFIDL